MMRRAAIIKQFVNTSRDPLALNLMQVLCEMGFEIELATDQRSDLATFWRNSGKEFHLSKYRTLLPFTINDTFLYERFLTMMLAMRLNVDLAVDVHGDFPPYILKNATPIIEYILWPTSAYLYGEEHARFSSVLGKLYLRPFKFAGDVLTRLAPNPFYLVTITQYVRRAVKRLTGLDSHVIYPPVDVPSFASGLEAPKDEKAMLVVCRISPEKQIERAIRILGIINEKERGWRLTIAGALSPFNRSYYEKLLSLSKGLPVEIRPNQTKGEILAASASSGVYLHTMLGEHFGISIIEAMASGLVPVVPDFGGAIEFVPSSLRYREERQAAEIILEAKNVSDTARRSLSERAKDFSEASFRSKFKEYLRSLGF